MLQVPCNTGLSVAGKGAGSDAVRVDAVVRQVPVAPLLLLEEVKLLGKH